MTLNFRAAGIGFSATRDREPWPRDKEGNHHKGRGKHIPATFGEPHRVAKAIADAESCFLRADGILERSRQALIGAHPSGEN
jgi:hypothetical protein